MTRSPINILLIAVCLVILSARLSHAESPAVFILGDSLYDVGTNSYILTALAKANFPYYGIDFFNSTPNGRFSNGLNLADFTAKVALGESVTSPPPFHALYKREGVFSENLVKAIDFDPKRPWVTPKGFDLAWEGTEKENPAKGINFASSGAGIIDKTSAIDLSVPVTEQLNELMFVRGNLTATIGAEKTQYLFAKSTFFVCLGNNDINFFVMTGQDMNEDAYIDQLIDSYNSTLRVNFLHSLLIFISYDSTYEVLYNVGVRKFGIFGIPYVGCVPLVRVTVLSGECSKRANDMAIIFNSKLEKLLYDMKTNFEGMVYSFANSYDVLYELVHQKDKYNFTNVIDACCGLGRFKAMSNCHPLASLCQNRKEYLFWDIAHPTQYAAAIIINKFQFGGENYARPINWAKLASL
ncbi:hypothetical protein OSB04_005924 [Centaurea solstitialis]|uniref:GDSL esterase/lipase n=1 Tax=Centaurea solstitialis TaxID=347529 RepID=A0AA38WRQ5_9ASTR|nr:hypothetical protein OSB04_005924 [Centaurea solstitialis]